MWLSSQANTAKHQSINHNSLDADAEDETTCSSEEKLEEEEELSAALPPRTRTAQQHNTRRAAMEFCRLVIDNMVSSQIKLPDLLSLKELRGRMWC